MYPVFCNHRKLRITKNILGNSKVNQLILQHKSVSRKIRKSSILEEGEHETSGYVLGHLLTPLNSTLDVSNISQRSFFARYHRKRLVCCICLPNHLGPMQAHSGPPLPIWTMKRCTLKKVQVILTKR